MKRMDELMLTCELKDLIIKYYNMRGLKWPNFNDAMKFALTEVGEVYEIDLARVGGWVRNNPDSKPDFDVERLSTELGDVIMMLMVAGIVEGVDPIQSLINKINKKLNILEESFVEHEPDYSEGNWK